MVPLYRVLTMLENEKELTIVAGLYLADWTS